MKTDHTTETARGPPAWSGDGRRIAFVAVPTFGKPNGVVRAVVKAGGTEATRGVGVRQDLGRGIAGSYADHAASPPRAMGKDRQRTRLTHEPPPKRSRRLNSTGSATTTSSL
jgi:hypothetical protein